MKRKHSKHFQSLIHLSILAALSVAPGLAQFGDRKRYYPVVVRCDASRRGSR